MGTSSAVRRGGRGLLVVSLVGLLGSGGASWAGGDEGQTVYTKKASATTFQDFLTLALQGDRDAQFVVGSRYRDGQGVPPDYLQAVFWYRQAAGQGAAEAQLYLGLMYNEGLGVPQDYAQAVVWYRKAAEQGIAEAQQNLAMLYEHGLGVPQDYGQAYFWYNLAAARLPVAAHRDTAVRYRDAMAMRLTPAQLASAQAAARIWQPTTAPAAMAAQPGAIPRHRVVAPNGSAVPVSPSAPRHTLVRQVQHRLQAQGFTPGAIDGTMGPQTHQALRWFQNRKGLRSTGELDKKTLAALGVR